MKRIIIEQGQQLAKQIETESQQIARQIETETDKTVGRFCLFELRNLKKLHDYLYSPFMDHLMVTVTSTGNLGLIWIFIALILMLQDTPRRSIGYSMLIALLLCITIGNLIIKNLVRRNRPFFHKNYKLLIKQPWDYSFPSGHTLSSFAAATVLFFMNKDVGILALMYASLIALSRLYLRVHFFTDVFFSMVLGTGLGILAVKAYETGFFGLI
ncbi:MAG: phosphatase PAP2 family protein [Clostridiales bacterium]|nr:phosphatase PAP2 family protein [Clostridiales bacterium]